MSLFVNTSLDPAMAQFFGGFGSIDWNGQGWGLYNSGATTTRYGVWWDAARDPNGINGWTPGGAGVEGSSAEEGLLYDFTGAASTRYWERLGTAAAPVVVWARRRQDSGGSLAADQSAIRLQSANGTFDYDITVRFTTTAIRMVDNNNAGATVGTDATGLTASDMLDVLISLGSTGRAVVWYKAATSQVWIQGPTGNVTNDSATPSAQSYLRWGHWSNSAQKATWLQIGSSLDAGPAYPVSVVEPNNPARINFGAEASIWPQYLADGRRYRAATTPARTGEAWTLSPSWPWPLDNLDPIRVGSPQLGWRSADDQAVQIIGWDRGDTDQPLSSAIGVYLRGANFLTCSLQSWDGAAWQTVQTISTVLCTGTYARDGYLVTPTSTTGSVSVARDELRGSWVVLADISGDLHYRRIAANSPGTWSNATDALQVWIRIEGDLTALDTSGDITIIAPEVAAVVNARLTYAAALWRFRIPARTYASADTAMHRLDKLLIGPFLAWGQQPSWGRALGMEVVQQISTAPNRRRTVKSLQRRPLRVVDIPFTDPILARDIYTDPADGVPDTVALASTGPPLAFAHDPRAMAEDVLLQAIGALYPVVYLARLTPPGETLIQRDMLLYGRVMTESSIRTGVIGEEGVMEIQTVGTLRIEEEG